MVRAIAPGAFVSVPAIAAVWEAHVRASFATLGRDQGIFQYVAWAILHGERAYRDVRDVNGPLVPMVHAVFQMLGGADEHRFRILDLVLTGVAAALVGACLPAIERDEGRPHALLSWRTLSLGVGAWVLLSAQYIAYGFWDTAQRESYCDVFLLGATGLLLVGQRALADKAPSKARTSLFGAGALSILPWFAKPTFVVFTFVALISLLVDDVAMPRMKRIAPFVLGMALGALGPLSFLLAWGDVAAWMHATFVDVPTMYRFIWPRTAAEIALLPGYSRALALALTTSTLVAVLVARGSLPRRALVVAAMAPVGIISVLAQGKGFPYHFHPVSAGMWVSLLVLVQYACKCAEASTRLLPTALAGLFAIAVGARAASAASNAPYLPAPRDGESMRSPSRLRAHERVDFFPNALDAAAKYLAANTPPDARVQTYAMDPYVLFLAERKSATPYIYAFDLNADAALQGSFHEGGIHPTSLEADRIVALRNGHEQDLFLRLASAPPAAFVLVDRSPLMSSDSALRDFEIHCPLVFEWFHAHYRESAVFETVHVWLEGN